MAIERNREACREGPSILPQASEDRPVVPRSTGGDQEKEKLSWGYCSRICHLCTKREEELIADKDILTSNPASRDCVKWVSATPWCPIYMQPGGRRAREMALGQRLACRAGTGQAMEFKGLERKTGYMVFTSDTPGWPGKHTATVSR